MPVPKVQKINGKKSGAPEGNQNAARWNLSDKESMINFILVLEAYCKHLESGYSKQCFVECDYETIEKYIKEYDIVFGTDIKERYKKAMKGNRLFWEGLGIDGTSGDIKGFNAKSWEFNMKNRYKWADKKEVDFRGKIKTSKLEPEEEEALEDVESMMFGNGLE